MKEVILIPSYEPDKKLISLIETINRNRFDIIVVDDGSGKKYQDIFQKICNKVYLISYVPNMGKGHALKKGLSYIKEKYQKDYLVITMDSDGQHTIGDAIKLSNYAKEHLNTYVLGMRKRNSNTPLRSKIGNRITKFVYYITTGVNIYDTQTGLRCFSNTLTEFLLNTPGERFEYEMNALLSSPKNGIKLHEIEIETIYMDNNKGTHFKTLRDSYLIYKDIFKFGFSSIISFIIDYSLFSIFSIFLSLTLSNILARIISATCNYTLNRKLVFKSKNSLYKTALSYISLAILILMLNTILLNILVEKVLLNKFIAKLMVEACLFIFSYYIQNKYIFKRR